MNERRQERVQKAKAREHDANAIVVGAHGHRALSELLLGSTSHSVLQRAECPVVVVRE